MGLIHGLALLALVDVAHDLFAAQRVKPLIARLATCIVGQRIPERAGLVDLGVHDPRNPLGFLELALGQRPPIETLTGGLERGLAIRDSRPRGLDCIGHGVCHNLCPLLSCGRGPSGSGSSPFRARSGWSG